MRNSALKSRRGRILHYRINLFGNLLFGPKTLNSLFTQGRSGIIMVRWLASQKGPVQGVRGR